MEKNRQDPEHPILLFDGVCNLCNHFVQFVIQRDPEAVFRFAPLQSDIGRQLSEQAGLPLGELNTVVLYTGDQFYTHSDVALEVVRRLPGFWPLLYGFKVLPKFLRDAGYNWVAQNRYRWFGRKESCMVPTPDLKRRFL